MFDYQSFVIAPLVGAVIGYITNWLAIKMLFRPRTEKRLLGIKLPFTPGLIPKERFRITDKIGETVGGKLLTVEVLSKELSSEKTQKAVTRLVDEAITSLKESKVTLRSILGHTLTDTSDRLGGTIGDLLPETTVTKVLEYIQSKLPDIARAIIQAAADNPRLDEELSKLTDRVINENLGRFIGFFLDPEKIYKNLKLELSIFISNTENHTLLVQKIREYTDSLLERDTAEAENLLKQIISQNGIMDMPISRLIEWLGEDNLNKLKAIVLGWVNKGIYKAAEFAAQTMDISGMVVEKMNSFSLEESEEIILSVVQKELTAITIVGGVLGFIIGLVPGIISLF